MKKLIIAANLGNLRVLRHLPAGEDPIEQEHRPKSRANPGGTKSKPFRIP
jgi:hypothetical protein